MNRALDLDGVEESAVYSVLVGEADRARNPSQKTLAPGDLRRT
jgi:hypothetical protein